jgi:nucleotide-binding universal stress UspA family protein
MTTDHDNGPVLFAYDGSDLATHAIQQAGQLLATPRPALIVTVWQPFDVGFVPTDNRQFDAAEVGDVRRAAEATAAAGAVHAQTAGFAARSIAIEAAPTWKALVDLADQHDASLIVLGSHSRSGISGALLGSVAASVTAHWPRSILIVHHPR